MHRNVDHRLGAGPRVRDELTGRGIAVASVGYRLSGEERFPAQVHDVSAGPSSGIAAADSWFGPANLATQPQLGPLGSGITDPGASPEAKLLGAPAA